MGWLGEQLPQDQPKDQGRGAWGEGRAGGFGEQLPQDQPKDKILFAPHCLMVQIEGEVFAHLSDLVTDLQLVIFDTTSISVEGQGGQDIGQRSLSYPSDFADQTYIKSRIMS